MLENFKSLKLKGGFFKEETSIDLFKNSGERVSFIFGRNGSGKTSISNALYDYKNNDFSNFEVVSLSDVDSNDIILDEVERKKLFVFNERFVDNHIKFSDDGINTIVMFGKQLEIDEKIVEKEKVIFELKENYKELQEKRFNYELETNSNSPQFYKNKILDILRGDFGWAYREQQIKGNVKKSPVTDIVFQNVISTTYNKDIKDIKIKLENNIKFLSSVSVDSSKYLPLNFNNSISEEYLKKLALTLEKEIQKPVLTVREKEIFNILMNFDTNYIETAKKHFNDTDLHLCPFCFQEISMEYKENLLEEFNNILNKDTEEHKRELESLLLEKINLDLKDYYSLDSTLCNEIVSRIERINMVVNILNNKITEKINNVYKPIKIGATILLKVNEELINFISKLNNKIVDYNKNVDNVDNLIRESSKLNFEISRNEINAFCDLYYDKLNKYNECIKEINSLYVCINKEKAELNSLNACKKNFTIALDIINKDLEYIFFGKKRLSLIYENDKYKVLSRGESVELKKVSVGERNVIALCYFFALVLENTSDGISYNNDFFLLIDDPISSFDFENKIGIYSFLRLKLSKILKNNSNNKCVIFTHELEAMNNFDKFRNDFSSEYKSKIICLNLYNNKTDVMTNIHRNNYTQSFICMYNYADNPSSDLDESIGNIMRKVIEAFSTFCYKQDIENLMRDEEILDLIPEYLRDYFGNFMYRFILHNESHYSDVAKAYPEKDFYSFVSSEEKQITAKNIIIFMYLINPIHVRKQLGGNCKFIEKVELWKKELEKQYLK